VALGGTGYHIRGEHRVTLPNLYRQVLDRLAGWQAQVSGERAAADPLGELEREAPRAGGPLRDLAVKSPELEGYLPDLARAFLRIKRCFDGGGTLFLAGNGGSMADALHISGELTKGFRLKRPLPPALRARLAEMEGGTDLAQHLQQGLRAVVLGANPALASAVLNDNPLPGAGLAQELTALARPGDVFLGISTSGQARNVLNAALAAKAGGVGVISLTGEAGGPLAGLAEVALRAPAGDTAAVQELHIRLYHTLCAMLEDHYFGETV